MKLCDYGCGNEANFKFMNGKEYCSRHVSQCPKYKEMYLIGKKPSKETRKKISEKIKYIARTDEKYRKSQSESRKMTLEQLREKYPLFSKIEETRYKPGTKNIQVRCKNHNCSNSKEKDGWFTPTYIRLYERIRQLEKDYGKDGCFLYCSDECKIECPLSHVSIDPFTVSKEKPFTDAEYNFWRFCVLEINNYECQRCGSKENIEAHHIQPVKTHPHLALDIDNGLVFCKKCHLNEIHVDECSTGSLAMKVCS